MYSAIFQHIALSAVGTIEKPDDATVPYLRSPAPSNNGEQIAFCYAGDIWIVPINGGEARMVTSHNNYDDLPRFSPDDSMLAFTSKRTGNGDIYVISLETEDVQRLTYHDGGDALSCWSPDGKWLYFNCNRDGMGSAIHKVSIDGGTPVKIAGDPYETYYNIAVSPDGKTLAFNNNGHQWWRHGPNPGGMSDIWIVGEAIGSQDYRKITDFAGRNMWPMWNSDGKGLYFVSDRDSMENIWYKDIEHGEAEQITHFEDDRVLRPSISGNGSQIVFERNFGIWHLDLETRDAAPVSITVRADKKVNNVTHRTYDGNINEFALSPDAKKIIFTNRGKIFAASAEKGTEKGRSAFHISNTTSRDGQICWNPDSSKMVYVSDRNGDNQLFLYDFQKKEEKHLTEPDVPARNPKFSQDGKWIAYYHDRDEIRLIDTETHEIRPFIESIFVAGVHASSSFAWSPDSKWIAFTAGDDNYFFNLYVQNIDETEAKQISFLSHIGCRNVLWSPDGKYVIFGTGQYRTESQIARVDLCPILPDFREDEFDKLFEKEEKKEDKDKDEEKKEGEGKEDGDKKNNDEKKKEPEPVKIVLEGIKHRLRFLSSPQMNAHALAISPDSKMMIYSWHVAGASNLWSICFDEDRKGDPPKQLTSSKGYKGRVHFVKDGKKIYYLDGGKVHHLKIAENGGKDGNPKALETRAEMDTYREDEKMHMFHEAWRLIRDNFYDPELHGADWETVREQLLPVVQGVQTQEDFHEILCLMVGELNASHLGAGGGGGPVNDSYLGVDFDWAELAESGRFKVTSVLPESPAVLPEEPIKVGEYILAADGVELSADANIWDKLKYKARKRVILSVNDKPEMEGAREVLIQPMNHGTMSNLGYRNWINENAAYVHEKSDGRLGYVHIKAMSYEAYMKLLVDLDTEAHSREGIVVDVRFNGGGHIASFILDVLRKRSFAQSIYRRGVSTSSTNLGGNRILEKPLIMVQNEHSGSNTEMFSEGFRRFGLGKVVGMPSAGAVIWTTNRNLLDGTWFRVPFVQVATLDGENLEGASRSVDIVVHRPLGEAVQGKDSQLDAAIDHLLKQIDKT